MFVDSPDEYSLGYHCVDDDPHAPVLFAAMDETATWPATRELRAWERERLALQPGERVLDVGCGLGDAMLALAGDLGPDGEVVGIDVSAAMIAVARRRAASAPCATRFAVGDALALAEPDQSFDAARSERTLQWVADPQRAVAELARVVRPGGRLTLLDTDWSTLRLDIGNPEMAARVAAALRVERGRPSNVGRRLDWLVRTAGLDLVDQTAATHRWTQWNPDITPVPPGCFSMRSLADDLVDTGQLAAADIESFVGAVHDAARAGRFSMSLTMYGVVARTA